MRFFQSLLAGAALIAAALATVEINEVPTSLKPGDKVTITYTATGTGAVEFILRNGDPKDLGTVGPIGTGNGGSFTWTVPDDLPNGNYAFQVKQGAEENYSGIIPLSGSTATATPSGSSSASASASASGSTSASASESTSEGSTLTTATSASASISSSAGGNSTVSSQTLSRTGTATTSPTGSGSPTRTGAPENTGAAAILGSSPMALIFGAVAAMAYLN